MPPITERGGVRFDEKQPENFERIFRLDTKINSGFGHAQLKSLRDVKDAMAREARARGADYIANFSYGQKNGGILRQLWSIDKVMWFATGDAGTLKE